jgi:hypothetical protein
MQSPTELDYQNMLNYLERNGYDARKGAGGIIVQDPVQCSGRGGTRIEYKEVTLADWRRAIEFIETRS